MHLFHVFALTVRAGDVLTLVDDEVLGAVVLAAREVALQDALDTLGVADLGVDGGAGHVRHHGVATAQRVGDVAERVVLGSGLREPHVTTVAAEVAGPDGLSDVLLDDDGTTSGVDEPSAWESVSFSHAGSKKGGGGTYPSSFSR